MGFNIRRRPQGSNPKLYWQLVRARAPMQTRTMQNRRISLASGVLPEHDALTVAQAAVAAGYSDAGLMIRPDDWDLEQEDALLALKEQHGLGFLDVEVLWIPAGGELNDGHRLIVEVGTRLGADHVLVVSDEADPDVLAPALIEISAWCAGHKIRPMLEFLRITSIESLAQATELLAASNEHHFGILLDSLHLARSGELFALPSLDAALHPYIQLCDGLLNCAEDQPSLLTDALDLRSAPGEGELPLKPLLRALPADVALSLEVRSRHYRETYRDPVERAAKLLEQTNKFLDGEEHE
jgi:sugar phosphate isomerase/epimerase